MIKSYDTYFADWCILPKVGLAVLIGALSTFVHHEEPSQNHAVALRGVASEFLLEL